MNNKEGDIYAITLHSDATQPTTFTTYIDATRDSSQFSNIIAGSKTTVIRPNDNSDGSDFIYDRTVTLVPRTDVVNPDMLKGGGGRIIRGGHIEQRLGKVAEAIEDYALQLDSRIAPSDRALEIWSKVSRDEKLDLKDLIEDCSIKSVVVSEEGIQIAVPEDLRLDLLANYTKTRIIRKLESDDEDDESSDSTPQDPEPPKLYLLYDKKGVFDPDGIFNIDHEDFSQEGRWQGNPRTRLQMRKEPYAFEILPEEGSDFLVDGTRMRFVLETGVIFNTTDMTSIRNQIKSLVLQGVSSEAAYREVINPFVRIRLMYPDES